MRLSDLAVSREVLQPGIVGVTQTIARMAQLAMGPYGAQAAAIRDLAASIVARVPEKDFAGEIAAVHAWVQDHIGYRRDPVTVEQLVAPTAMMQLGHGDCDDLATMEAALLGALGHRTRFVTAGFRVPGRYSHVFLEVERKPGDWLPLDPTNKREGPGWQAARQIARRAWPVSTESGLSGLDAGAGGGLAVLAGVALLWWINR